MGRRFKEPYKSWKINLPATTAGLVEFYLMNPVTGKPTYGSRGELVNALLRDWIAQQESKAQTTLASQLISEPA